MQNYEKAPVRIGEVFKAFMHVMTKAYATSTEVTSVSNETSLLPEPVERNTILPKQVGLVQQAAIYVMGRHMGTPARLNWDCWYNLGYARSHWLHTPDDETREEDTSAFVKLVDHEQQISPKERTKENTKRRRPVRLEN